MIYVDSRIGSKHLVSQLEAMQLPVTLTKLEYGDASFLGRGPEDVPVPIGIELKNVLDLVNSMFSGRLSGHQIPGLLSQYQHVWLIVEGVYRVDRKTGMIQMPRGRGWVPVVLGGRIVYWRDVDHYLTTLEVATGVRTRRTRTQHETARTIASLYHWWTDKSFDEHRSHLRLDMGQDTVTLIEPTVKRKIAACLPGVGWERSAAIDKAFVSVRQMILADQKTWREIPGVGRILAKRIVALLEGE